MPKGRGRAFDRAETSTDKPTLATKCEAGQFCKRESDTRSTQGTNAKADQRERGTTLHTRSEIESNMLCQRDSIGIDDLRSAHSAWFNLF